MPGPLAQISELDSTLATFHHKKRPTFRPDPKKVHGVQAATGPPQPCRQNPGLVQTVRSRRIALEFMGHQRSPASHQEKTSTSLHSVICNMQATKGQHPAPPSPRRAPMHGRSMGKLLDAPRLTSAHYEALVCKHTEQHGESASGAPRVVLDVQIRLQVLNKVREGLLAT